MPSPASDPDGAPSTLELDPWTPEAHADAVGHGYQPIRALLQMRCPLPRSEAWSLPVRSFVPGSADEARWLEVNNRAFHWHPEQSGWSLDTLHRKMAEPWFDADGFLLAEDANHDLIGFCWTKVHEATPTDPALGEIFVIGVDPDHHGRGLGRALTLAGLDTLSQRGLTTGMLYVESDNEAALHLYRSLGFTEHHRHVWYERRPVA